ncbi:hypothetical protein E4H12_01980 [Candidatus Thorarchaeota archaeon]|nr:MAG: hypothetical protein E4H12_01980 [Candidatus Thorarchaeota archaeon]
MNSILYILAAIAAFTLAIILIPTVMLFVMILVGVVMMVLLLAWAGGMPIVIKVDGMRVGELRWFTYYPDKR